MKKTTSFVCASLATLLGIAGLMWTSTVFAWQNWDASISCPKVTVYTPKTPEDIPLTGGPYRIVGMNHSWNVKSCTFKGVIQTIHFNSPPKLYQEGREEIVEVGSGVRLKDLLHYLEQHGRSLPTFPNLPDLTVGGAVATASHGTAFEQGTISDSVVGVDVTPANNQPIALGAYAASVGKLGVITKLKLRTIPSPILERQVDLVSGKVLFRQWDCLLKQNQRLQAWYDIPSQQVLLMRYNPPKQGFAPLPTVAAPAHDFLSRKLKQMKPNTTGTLSQLFLESNLEPRLEAEYAIDLSQAVPAIQGLENFLLSHHIALIRPLLIRFGGPDSLPWLSPAYGNKPVVFINVDLKSGQQGWMTKIESYLVTHFHARFHMGKWFSHDPEMLEKAYGPQIAKFNAYQSPLLKQLYGQLS